MLAYPYGIQVRNHLEHGVSCGVTASIRSLMGAKGPETCCCCSSEGMELVQHRLKTPDREGGEGERHERPPGCFIAYLPPKSQAPLGRQASE